MAEPHRIRPSFQFTRGSLPAIIAVVTALGFSGHIVPGAERRNLVESRSRLRRGIGRTLCVPLEDVIEKAGRVRNWQTSVVQSTRFPTPRSGRTRRSHVQGEHQVLHLMEENGHLMALLPFRQCLVRALIVPMRTAPPHFLVPAVGGAGPTRAYGQFLTLLARAAGAGLAPPRSAVGYIGEHWQFLTLHQQRGPSEGGSKEFSVNPRMADLLMVLSVAPHPVQAVFE